MSSTHKLSKWGSLVGQGGSWKKQVIAMLLENQEKYSRTLLSGPYYCDELGEYIDVDDAANPEYDPYVIFKTDYGLIASTRTYVYHLDKETFYLRTPIIIEGCPKTPEETEELVNRINLPSIKLTVIDKKCIPDWVIKEIFKREPEIYALGIGKFSKFVMPLIRKSYPSLLGGQNLVSVQPMTGPIGGIAFYKSRYGNGKGGV